MQLNDIEMSIAVGRTAQGKTISVGDIMKVLAKVSGTGLGSQQFDQILADPQQLHAPDMLTNARRYALLCSLLDGRVQAPAHLELEASLSGAVEPALFKVHIHSPSHSDHSECLSKLLDDAMSAKQSRP